MAHSEPVFVDTNVFMRFIVRDDDEVYAQCRALFERVEPGTVRIWTSHLVLAEIVWTLGSYYERPRAEIAEILDGLLDMQGLQLERPETVRDAIDLYRNNNVDFTDAYGAADARRRGQNVACTFDRDFDRLGITRLEPSELIGDT